MIRLSASERAAWKRKGHKYHAVRTTVDGVTFASKLEARTYGNLKLLEKAGHIRNLILQPRFPLMVAGTLVATYVADFKYELAMGPTKARRWKVFATITCDAKGMITPVYRLKKKLLRALYGIEITEVTK